MIKIIIANNNDILYNSLSDIALKTKEKIEIINVPIDKINSLFCQIRAKENLIILDSITSVTFCTNVLKNAINRIGKRNIVILVIDSNVINAEIQHQLFKKKPINFPIWDIVGLVSDSLKDSLEIERNIDTILWRMGFTSCKAKGYLKDAILLAYTDKTLLLDTQNLIKKVAEKNNIENERLVRSDIDKTLNNVLDLIDKDDIFEIFGNEYDGRKISLKYFIDLCIRHLELQKYCYLN